MTNDSENVVSSGVLICSISDHSLTFIIRRARRPRAGCKNIHYRNFKHYKPHDFIVDLQSASWDMINTTLTIEDAWLAFKRTRHTSLPWITADIRISMKSRDYHHKRAQKTGLQSEWLAYRSMRNKTTSLLRESKRNYYSKQVDENKSDSGKLWKTLNQHYH